MGPRATFRSPEQRAAVEEIEKGTSPLVVVLPTGGGKSLLFQLLAVVSQAGTTIVVLPFRALTADLAAFDADGARGDLPPRQRGAGAALYPRLD